MLKSASPELVWPAVVPPRLAAVFAAFVQLESSQWLPAAQLRMLQARQLAARLQHAARASAWFSPQLAGADLRPAHAFDTLARLPVLTRASLQRPDAGLICATGEVHGPQIALNTSGSSGEPVQIRCTQAAQVLRQAFMMRSFAWQQLDSQKIYASIRSGLAPAADGGPQHARNWNAAMGGLFGSGPSWSFPISEPLARQLAVLASTPAHYLASYPSNLRGLLALSPANPRDVEVVISQGEALDPALAAALSRAWGVRVVDEYSSEELGPIATQCEHGQFHCMAEGLVVELLRADGSACAPGELGRVVVTDLRNFATALLRYDTADFAEAGAACACGRGLPTLGRIRGRERNLAQLPDGGRFWPNLAPLQEGPVRERVRQFQIRQVAPTALVLRVHPARPLDEADRTVLAEAVRAAFGAVFNVSFEVFDGPLPKGPNGKFMEFQCLLPAGESRRN